MNKKNNQNSNDSAISEAIDLLTSKGIDLSTMLSEGGLLKQFTKRLVEKALESEMDDHLGYTKYTRTDTDNARNGVSSKNLIIDNGLITIEVPRDRGLKLSGGEKQRISLARLFLKNPKICIFDESNSSLDKETDLVIQKNIEKYFLGVTKIIITHRPHIIHHKVDQVISIDNYGVDSYVPSAKRSY